MEKLTEVVLSLGSNLGDRLGHIDAAIEALRIQAGEVHAISPMYETPPFGFQAEQNFINLCLELHTSLSANELLSTISDIEHQLGRKRSPEGYISRTIDLDILFFGQDIIAQKNLSVPHPSFRERKFVLVPLNDLDPKRTDPVTGRRIDQILADCKDTSTLSVYQNKIIVQD